MGTSAKQWHRESTGTDRIPKPPQRQGLLARIRDQGGDGFLPQKNDAVTIVVAAQ